jgi:hypothetical protein
MELSFIVRDQEVDGSNPFAPTILFKSAIYITRRIGILEEKSKSPVQSPLSNLSAIPLRHPPAIGARRTSQHAKISL